MTEELTDKNYNEIIEKTNFPIFIDFYSETCGPCQILLSYIDNIYEYGKTKKVKVVKCNVDINPKISKKYFIRTVPLTLIVTEDKKIKYVEAGIKDYYFYINLIDKISPMKTNILTRIKSNYMLFSF